MQIDMTQKNHDEIKKLLETEIELLETINKRQKKENHRGIPITILATVVSYATLHVYLKGEPHFRQSLIDGYDMVVNVLTGFVG